MDKKKIIAVVGILILTVVVYQFLKSNSSFDDTGYLLKNNNSIKLDDIRMSLKKSNFKESEAADYFSEDVVNSYTLKYFKFMQMKFKEFKTLGEHLDAVRKYLYASIPAEDAEKLFALYKTFVKYEDALAVKMKEWMGSMSSGNSIEILKKMHEYQKECFGEEVALKLFGADIKAREYPLRRKAIIVDDSLYGKEKEDKINKLNRDMWGDEAEAVEARVRPIDRYREKMNIYDRDLKELDSEERTDKIREFREDLFSPEVVERLEKVDALLDARKERDAQYRLGEEQILNDPNLSEKEKNEKIVSLQNKIFGEDADAFRRREEISKSRK